MSADLAALAADPERIEDVDRETLHVLIGQLETLKARMWTRLQQPPTPAGPTRKDDRPDELLTVEEVAERLHTDKRWVYRQHNAGALPFARKLSSGTLRFSSKGLERWMESRR